MTGASEDLLQAVYGLRKAAEGQFTGNTYYQVANEINELLEILGWGSSEAGAGQGAAYGFSTMLDEVRKFARTSTSGSLYSAITYKLDVLASYLTAAGSAPAPVSEKPAVAAAPAPAPEAEPAPAVAAAPVAEPAPAVVAAPVAEPAPAVVAAPVAEPAPAAAAAPVAEPAPAVAAAPAAEPAPAVAAAESEDLLQAVYSLRKAAEAEFTGNTYYQVANEIDGLIETVGGNEGGFTPGQGAAYGFATAIDEVRRLAKARTEGNQYYSIAVKLDRLASHLTPAAPVSEKPAATAPAAAPVTAPASAPVHTPSPAKPTFDDLAAASKARVEVVAAGLGIVPAHHIAPPHLEAPDVLGTHNSELAPIAGEQVAAAEAPAKPADHVHDGAGDVAKCPFQALLADTAEEAAAEPAPAPEVAAAEAVAAPLPADHVHHAAEGDGAAKCPFHESPGAPVAAQEASAPASAEKVASFDELAAASKAQVEHVAAGLGVEVAHPETPLQAEAVVASGERRLESRSSEGVGRVLESVEPTVVAAETAPEPCAQEAAPDLGSPAAQGEAPAVEEAVIIEVAAPAPAVVPEPASADAAPELVEPAAKAEVLAVEEAVIVEVAAPAPAVAPEPALAEAAPDLVEPAAKAEVLAVEEAVIAEVAAPASAVAPEPALADAAPELVEPAAKAEVLAVEEAVIVEVAAPAPAVAPEPALADAAPELVEPAAKAEVLAVEEAVIVEVAAPAPAAAPEPAQEPAPEAAAVAPVQKIEVKPAEPKRKEPKTLFKLWLDLAFGRKD
jgi:hypothetical protein